MTKFYLELHDKLDKKLTDSMELMTLKLNINFGLIRYINIIIIITMRTFVKLHRLYHHYYYYPWH